MEEVLYLNYELGANVILYISIFLFNLSTKNKMGGSLFVNTLFRKLTLVSFNINDKIQILGSLNETCNKTRHEILLFLVCNAGCPLLSQFLMLMKF